MSAEHAYDPSLRPSADIGEYGVTFLGSEKECPTLDTAEEVEEAAEVDSMQPLSTVRAVPERWPPGLYRSRFRQDPCRPRWRCRRRMWGLTAASWLSVAGALPLA